MTTNVRAGLAGDKLLKGAVLTVATSPTGKVTLVGMVPNVTAKQEANGDRQGDARRPEVDDQMRLPVTSPQGPSQNSQEVTGQRPLRGEFGPATRAGYFFRR